MICVCGEALKAFTVFPLGLCSTHPNIVSSLLLAFKIPTHLVAEAEGVILMIIRTYYRKNIVLVASYINMKMRSKFIANNVIFNINDFFLLHCFLLPIFFSVNFGNTMQDFFFPYNCLLVGIVFLKEHSRITKGICLGIERTTQQGYNG